MENPFGFSAVVIVILIIIIMVEFWTIQILKFFADLCLDFTIWKFTFTIGYLNH